MKYNQRQHKLVLCPIFPFSQLTAGPSDFQVYVQYNVSLMLGLLLVENSVSCLERSYGRCCGQAESPSAIPGQLGGSKVCSTLTALSFFLSKCPHPQVTHSGAEINQYTLKHSHSLSEDVRCYYSIANE